MLYYIYIYILTAYACMATQKHRYHGFIERKKRKKNKPLEVSYFNALFKER